MWNRAKTVLMTIILVAVFLTVYFSFYLKAYMPVSKQWNAASFQYSRFSFLRSDSLLIAEWHDVPVSSPLHFEMSDASSLFEHRFGINLTSSTKVQFKFLATAPVNFRVEKLEHDSIGLEPSIDLIIWGDPTTSMDFEFYVEDSGFYVFDFDPVQSNPDATVIFDARLDC